MQKYVYEGHVLNSKRQIRKEYWKAYTTAPSPGRALSNLKCQFIREFGYNSRELINVVLLEKYLKVLD